MRQMQSSSSIKMFVLSPDQNKIFALTEDGLEIINIENSGKATTLYRYYTVEQPKDISLSPDSSKLAITMSNGVIIINLASSTLFSPTYIWYPSHGYFGIEDVSFASNFLFFAGGYIIDLGE